MRSYFNFNRKEKIGVTALAGLILAGTVVLNVGSTTYVPDPFDIDESKLEFLNTADRDEVPHASQVSDQWEKKDTRKELSKFDPNKIDLNEWIGLGFSEKQGQSIVNYRQNYGPFKKKEDIHKLYVVSDEKYAELEPFIAIVYKAEEHVVVNEYRSEEVRTEPLELNTASEEELMTLNGIGPSYADRIIKYRIKIGGFIDIEQVEGLYIGDEAKAVLIEQCTIDFQKVKRTKINSASKDDIRNVPYSNWAVVAAILKKRETEKINDLDFLTEKEITIQDKEKFALYIDFED